MKTLGQFLEEAKATYCGRCGTTHVPPAKGGTCPAVKESAYDSELEDHHPRKVQGVYGVKSKSFEKKFKNQAAQDKYFDHPDRQGNYEIHYVTKLHEEAEQIDELSTEKLLQYMKKASDARGHRKLPLKKVDNRYAGVHKASAKLDKRFNEEAEQIDEAGLVVPRRDNLVSLKQHSFPDAEKKRKGLLKPIKTDYERQMDDAHSHIYKEDLDEGTIKVGTYMTKSGDALVLHRAEHDPKHHMLIRKSDGKVVAGHQGTSQEVHDKLTKETGLSGALHEAITTAKGETTEAGTRHEMRVTKVLHNGEHVASIHTYRGRAGGWTSGVHTPDGKSASKKYGIDLMDTKKQMLSKIKNYHKGN